MHFEMKYPYQQSEKEKKEAEDYPWHLNSTKRKVVLDKMIELARHREKRRYYQESLFSSRSNRKVICSLAVSRFMSL